MFKNKRTAMVGTLVVALFLPLLTLLTPREASAAYDCYLKIRGQKQGDIKGDATAKGQEHSIDIISWSFAGSVPRDPQSGLPTGKVSMHDLKFTMRVSMASPKLFQALASNETISQAELNVYGLDEKGAKIQLLKITLANAKITSMLDLGNSKSTETRPVEEVIITFGKIQFVYVPGAVTFEYTTPVQP